MLTATLGDAANAVQVVDNEIRGKIAELIADRYVPIRTKTRLKRMWQPILDAHDEYQTGRHELFEKYVEREDDGSFRNIRGQAVFKDEESEKAFKQEHEELLAVEANIPGERLKYPEDFLPRVVEGGPVDVIFSTLDLIQLAWLIDDGSDDEAEETTTDDFVEPVEETVAAV